MNKKFKFIELPRPEITLTPEGESHILGGDNCGKFIVCPENSGIKDQCKSFNSDMCEESPEGCEGLFHCGQFSTCGAYNFDI